MVSHHNTMLPSYITPECYLYTVSLSQHSILKSCDVYESWDWLCVNNLVTFNTWGCSFNHCARHDTKCTSFFFWCFLTALFMLSWEPVWWSKPLSNVVLYHMPGCASEAKVWFGSIVVLVCLNCKAIKLLQFPFLLNRVAFVHEKRKNLILGARQYKYNMQDILYL